MVEGDRKWAQCECSEAGVERESSMVAGLSEGLPVELEMAPREEIREEMTSGEAGLIVTWFGERLRVAVVEGAFGRERRRDCLGVRTEVRGGMTGAGAESLIMTGKVSVVCRYGTQNKTISLERVD